MKGRGYDARSNLRYSYSARTICSSLYMDALYFPKKNEDREEQYQSLININQQVINEQAKSFESISKDINEIKQKIFKGTGI